MVDERGAVRGSGADVPENYEVPHPYETVIPYGLFACSAIAAMADLHEAAFRRTCEKDSSGEYRYLQDPSSSPRLGLVRRLQRALSMTASDLPPA